MFLSLCFCISELVSDFGLRISYFNISNLLKRCVLLFVQSSGKFDFLVDSSAGSDLQPFG